MVASLCSSRCTPPSAGASSIPNVETVLAPWDRCVYAFEWRHCWKFEDNHVVQEPPIEGDSDPPQGAFAGAGEGRHIWDHGSRKGVLGLEQVKVPFQLNPWE